MTNTQINTFKSRYDALLRQGGNTDYEKAKLFRDVRNAHPAGQSGLMQFRKFCKEQLRASPAYALKMIKLLASHRSEDHWKMLDGQRGLYHISSLPSAGRNIVKRRCIEQATAEDRPLTYSIIRGIALQAGFRSENNTGRPTQTEMERKVIILRNFVCKLYREYDDLPTMPRNVKNAMGPTMLEQLKEKLAQV